MLGEKVRTTVALAADLLAAIDLAVREGMAGSRSDFLALAVRNQLAAEQRARIDAQFAGMAADSAYRQEALEIADEFVDADWEALKIAEGHS